jgi:hypothetical protein
VASVDSAIAAQDLSIGDAGLGAVGERGAGLVGGGAGEQDLEVAVRRLELGDHCALRKGGGGPGVVVTAGDDNEHGSDCQGDETFHDGVRR